MSDAECKEAKELTVKQRLHWSHRCLNNIVSQLLAHREHFEQEEITAALNILNAGLKRIESKQRVYKPPRIAKAWSRTP